MDRQAIIDSHQHFWRYDPIRHGWINDEMKVLQRDFLPRDLEPVLKTNHVDGCIAVQAEQSLEETAFLLSLAEQHSFIKGVVGWVDLADPTLNAQFADLKRHPHLKGFRHIVQSEPAGFLRASEFINGVNALARHGFTYDLLIYHHQMEDALYFAQHVREVPIVIDHIAKPSIRTGEKTHWELNLAALATFSNMHIKLSGLVTEASWRHWTYDEITPYLDEVFETFGTDRIMYGSDWPVCLLAAAYEQQLEIVVKYIGGLSSSEKDKIMGGNAKRFYNI